MSEEEKAVLSIELDPESAPGAFTTVAQLEESIPFANPITENEFIELAGGSPFTHEIHYFPEEEARADIEKAIERVRIAPKIRVRTWAPRFAWLGWLNYWLPHCWPFFRRVEFILAVDPDVPPEIVQDEHTGIISYRFRAGKLIEKEEG